MKTLSEWLAHCESLHPHAIDMGLDRVRLVAQKLQLALKVPVITVAGTNGKGSTCAMLEAIYLQAGYKTGVYTSPHLVHFEERCRLQGSRHLLLCLQMLLSRLKKPEGRFPSLILNLAPWPF